MRPVAGAFLTSTCTIRAPGGTPGTFNKTIGEYVGGSTPAPHFTGACSVEDLPAAERSLLAADEQIPAVGYLVTLAHNAAPATAVGHVVTITAPGPNGDPTLAGTELRVESIERGSRTWTRALICTENQS